MTSKNASGQKPELGEMEQALNRAKVLLNAAQADFKSSQALLNRKSTGPHNVQKRLKKVQAASERIQKVMEAVSDFERALAQELLENVQQASREAPMDIQTVIAPEVGTESPAI